ncbi:uncharacterized protein DNG_03455 [Cephalotrichum gorgonifer]|uniref:Peptidase A1 domain-containing protein n=1 Tax=Cephalotrichum gorgonifer TaxID=2041049 RepID=A0AAE8MW85_9PEZI|nr:uncharacterized protein DNG_03455 [Cephalotrichum gorgonifer]
MAVLLTLKGINILMALGLVAALPSSSPREKADLPLAQTRIPARPLVSSDIPGPRHSSGTPRPGINVAVDDPELGPIAGSTGSVFNVDRQVAYAVDVEVQWGSYLLILDTGSSDTWVVTSPFTCYDRVTFDPVPVEECNFGPSFSGERPQQAASDMAFALMYGGNRYITGRMGSVDLSVAGITLEDQLIGFAEAGAWRGDNETSGLFALGPTAYTSASTESGAAEYDGVVDTIVKGGHPPVFALALSRDIERSFITLGGVPDIETGEYASAPLVPDEQGEYLQYFIQLDTIQAHVNGDEEVDSGSGSGSISIQFLLDCGTTVNYFPEDIADAVNAAFDPPSAWDADRRLYFTDCDAVPPPLRYGIGGKSIAAEPSSMVLPMVKRSDGKCATAVSRNTATEYGILGAAFFQGLVVAFDVEAMDVRIAERVD